MRDLLDASSYHLTECKFRNLSPTTIEQYQYYETAFCTWLTETKHGLALHQLNAPNVRECTLWLKERHAATAKRGGQFTAHFFVGAMKTWSRFLVYEDILEADFLAKLTRPKLVKVARIPFELHDIQAIRGALYQNSMGRRDVAMLALMLDTGVRIGELVGLELRDLDAASCRVLVRGKGNKERLLPFGGGERNGGKTGALLRDYLKARRAKPGVTRLFVNHKGDPLTADGWRDVFQDACRAAGVKDPQPHRVRHSFATRYLVRSPGDVEGLRYMLGHLDDDMYREYSGLAGQIIAQQAGRESLVEVWFAETPAAPSPRKMADRPANVTPLPASRSRHEPERRQRQHHRGRSRQRLVRLLLGVSR